MSKLVEKNINSDMAEGFVELNYILAHVLSITIQGQNIWLKYIPK